MINFKYAKSQFKSIKIPIILFSIFLFASLIPAFTYKYMAPYLSVSDIPNGNRQSQGAANMMDYTYFGLVGCALYFVFSIIMIYRLLNREVDKGYFAVWLATPMSRRTILNSKLFTILITIFSIQIALLIVQFTLLPILTKDFSAEIAGNLLLFNISYMLLILLWVSINWLIITYFDKATVGISVATAVTIVFIGFYMIFIFAREANFDKLKYFRFGSIRSLLNSPLHYAPLSSLYGEPGISPFPPGFVGVVTTEYLGGAKASEFAWQMPLMLGTAIGFYALGDWFICKRNFFL
ncbi:hypothetical protein SSYRP_v1c06970 [Spiroplasma syrphidicola EA-1]|uniref:Uncharacterized protein n=1 Tax=Spiroplasma syrphidicola EA-1 TaxID=1276229 RepID=R4U497_9MOLU|nr:ABC transporter permease subunit [Spiroplasma syrphidicola]AGM26287.1 hypothetical protein SSYRP_v1c06970 [Spiroplasma syrphidicola EA-1]